jgi:tryptophanyl-tRNA synthetase
MGKKMSKSYNNFIDIFLSDKKLRKQIMGIKTDSTPIEDPKDAESCNVFKLFKLLATDKQNSELKTKYAAGNFGYGHAKQELFELICDKYKIERKKFNHLLENKNIIDNELTKGAEKAKVIATEVLNRVRGKTGY